MVPVTEDREVAGYLEARCLDPTEVEARNLARAVPLGARLPAWARFQGKPWTSSGHRLVVPLYSASGTLESLHARSVLPNVPSSDKAASPAGAEVRGLVMTCLLARLMLAGAALGDGSPASEWVASCGLWIMEGVPDFPHARYGLQRSGSVPGRLFAVAAPNAGKTWLALIIAKAAATEGRKVYAVLEEGQSRPTGDRFESLAFPPDAPVEICHCRGFRLADKAMRRQLAALLQVAECPVLILDPFVSIFLGNENDTRDMSEARAHLDELAAVNPRALLVLLHAQSPGSCLVCGWVGLVRFDPAIIRARARGEMAPTRIINFRPLGITGC